MHYLQNIFVGSDILEPGGIVSIGPEIKIPENCCQQSLLKVTYIDTPGVPKKVTHVESLKPGYYYHYIIPDVFLPEDTWDTIESVFDFLSKNHGCFIACPEELNRKSLCLWIDLNQNSTGSTDIFDILKSLNKLLPNRRIGFRPGFYVNVFVNEQNKMSYQATFNLSEGNRYVYDKPS